MSTFCVIISLEYEEKLIVGVAYFPATNELYSAAISRGTSQNKKRLQVNRTHTLGQAIVATHPPRNDLTRTQFDAAWKLFGDLTYSVYRARHIAFDIFNLN